MRAALPFLLPLVALTVACDARHEEPPAEPRNCPAAWPPIATLAETSDCACEPLKGEEACPSPDLHCVEHSAGEFRCLAPWSGTPTKGGGEYHTTCAVDGDPKALLVPVNSDVTYCSACASCTTPQKNSLVCGE